MPISETSNTPADDAVRGENTTTGNGVHGVGNAGPGVLAVSLSGRGLEASSTSNYGVRASCSGSLAGLRASSVGGRGAEGWSTDHEGVVGISTKSIGVYGTGTGTVGVFGDSQSGRGVEGWSQTGIGVRGASNGSFGVEGVGTTGGRFDGSWEGLHVVGHNDVAAGLAAYNDHKGPAIYARNSGGGAAALIDGDLVVTGVIHMNHGDYAEDFTVIDWDSVQAGMVMVLDDDGSVRCSTRPYDRRVAGVVSGAGSHQPAVILDHQEGRPDRLPLALMGKAFCLVDASRMAVGVGDLLTTSAVPGHAMKATNARRAFGAVIGKALRPLAAGRGLVPILVRLQ